jgi:hypothetical protein
MTSTIETGKRVAMLATVGGIGATVALLIAASHTSGDNQGFALSLDYTGATKLWEIATAGVFWAAIFNWLFETWIWRLCFLQGWLVKVPDLSGVWTGTSESRFFKDKDGNYQTISIEASIDHRFDRIIYTQAGLGKNAALAVDLSTDENGFCTLTVVYHNLPQTRKAAADASEDLAENVREHYGCACLTLSRPPKQRTVSAQWALNGAYWTDKARSKQDEDRGTTGVLDLHWNRHL